MYPGVASDEYNVVSDLEELSGMYVLKEVVVKMSEYLHKPENSFFYLPYLQSCHENMAHFSESLNYGGHNGDSRLLFASMRPLLQSFFERNTVFPLEHLDKLGIYESKLVEHVYDKSVKLNKFVALNVLELMMHSVNRMFQPSYCGSQNGDDKASAALSVVTGNILKDRKKLDRY